MSDAKRKLHYLSLFLHHLTGYLLLLTIKISSLMSNTLLSSKFPFTSGIDTKKTQMSSAIHYKISSNLERGIYVSATISLVAHYNNISGKAFIQTERYKRFFSNALKEFLLCVIPKENNVKLNCSLLG